MSAAIVPAGKQVALLLQGGGALGSYQAGVYAALAEAGYAPDWVAGISIGAINAALIAGNAPTDRVDRLRAFWEGVTAPGLPIFGFAAPGYAGLGHAALERGAAVAGALTVGRPGFFARWDPISWMLAGFPPSHYHTDPLRQTLERLVDFDRIAAGPTRLSVGAVHVASGEMRYFDSRETRIGPAHVLASSALPPGFAAAEIEGEAYWDGGLVSNTPLQYVLSCYPRRSLLAFQVDVFAAAGVVPRDADGVEERMKEIRFASRTRLGTETFATMHEIRHRLDRLLAQLPEALRATPEARYLSEIACVTTMDIVQLTARPEAPEGAAKDYEFSRTSMEARWARGQADARAILDAAPWREAAGPEVGVRVFADAARAAVAG